MSEKLKPNCQKCYYGGMYECKTQLASCNCARINEPTVIKRDKYLNKERQFVHRTSWDEECKCEHYVPSLSEIEGDFELETVCWFETSFKCPFCDATIDVEEIGVDTTKLIVCWYCNRKMAIEGKST